MKAGDLVKLKDRSDLDVRVVSSVAIVISVDPRPGVSMCTLLGPLTDGKPAAYLMKHFKVINESR